MTTPPNSNDRDLKSYTSLKSDRLNALAEFWHVYRHKTADVPAAVAALVDTCREMEAIVADEFDLRLVDLDVLEVGAGQLPLRLEYFSRMNNVSALDYDVIPQGFDPYGYLRVLRENGLKRTLKTAMRKLSGIDRAYQKELARAIGDVPRRMHIIQGDAHNMPWPESTFDFAYSFSVFEHLRDPAKCLDEVIRVLRPGGVFCISTHMYSSDNGAHDPRSFLPHHTEPAPWAHLRPQHRDSVKPNAFCNRWRNAQWKELFLDRCDGVVLKQQPSGDWLRPRLDELREAGELLEYTDDELLTCELWAFWQKPS